jgi:hypothetical protein
LDVVDYIAVQFHGDGDLIVALAGAQGAGAHPGRFLFAEMRHVDHNLLARLL